MEFRRAVVPQPYDPDPNASSGDRQCQLRYHQYWATPGCGGFDHDTSFVVRTEQQPLSPAYYEPDSNWLLRQFRTCPDRHFGPPFFVNFPAVEVSCPEGMTATQYGPKVTNVKVTIDDPNVFGSTTWSTPGPFYA